MSQSILSPVNTFDADNGVGGGGSGQFSTSLDSSFRKTECVFFSQFAIVHITIFTSSATAPSVPTIKFFFVENSSFR